jgi:hypothetical protein
MEAYKINSLAVPAASPSFRMRIDSQGRSDRLDLPSRLFTRRLNLCALLVAFLAPNTLRAEFVISVPAHQIVFSADIASVGLTDESKCSRFGTCCKHSADSQHANRTSQDSIESPLAAMLKKRGAPEQATTGSRGNGNRHNAPLPQNQAPLPRENCPPADSYGHGMGGSAGSGSGGSSHPAGLPSTPVVTGPELAMRVFAREHSFQVEDFAWRFFRPPRAGCL